MPLISSLGIMNAINFGFASSVSEKYWLGTIGYTSYNATGNGVTVDSLGNIYICGTDNEYSSSANDMYVAKYTSGGVLVWQKYIRTASATNQDYAYSVAVDSSFNVFVVGSAYATSTIPGIAIFKLDSTGATQWQKVMYNTSTTTPFGYSIVLDSSGNVYISGSNPYSGYSEIYLSKITNAGVVSWQNRLGGAGTGTQSGARCITTDTSGNVYVSGQDTTILGGFYLAKYNSSGVLQWQQKLTFAGIGYASGNAIKVDSAGNIFFAGKSSAGGYYCGYLFKYNSSGVLQWQRKLSSSDDIEINSMCLDSSSNVYVCGTIQALSPTFHDLYVAKYDQNGNIQWQRKIATTSEEEGFSIASFGNSIYLTGYVVVSSQNYIFISKLNNNGNFIGSYVVGSATITISASSATDSASTLTDAVSTLTAGTSNIANTSTTALTFGNASLTTTIKSL